MQYLNIEYVKMTKLFYSSQNLWLKTFKIVFTWKSKWTQNDFREWKYSEGVTMNILIKIMYS